MLHRICDDHLVMNSGVSTRVHDLGVVAAAADALLGEVALHYPWPDQTWVRSNFISTIDGAVQGPDGRSGTINTEADHLVFDALRATCDVVLAGAGTVRTEGYRAVELSEEQRSVRPRGQTDLPALLVVSDSLDLPDDLRGGAAGAGAVHVITGNNPSPEAAAALTARGVSLHRTAGSRVTPGDIVELCRALKWQRILLEGGPHLHGQFVASGQLDEICLSLAPRVAGGDHSRAVAGAALDPPAEFTVAGVLLLDDTVMVRWVRAST